MTLWDFLKLAPGDQSVWLNVEDMSQVVSDASTLSSVLDERVLDHSVTNVAAKDDYLKVWVAKK